MIHEILVPLDMSPLAEGALPHARAMARVFGARIHLMSVVESPADRLGGVDSVDWRLSREERDAYLRRVATSIRAARLEADWETTGGIPAEQILAAARASSADLVVLTSHGRGGMSQFPLSGTVSKVISRTETSVLVVRPEVGSPSMVSPRYNRILASVDCSPRGDWAVSLAARIAEVFGSELLLVAVIETRQFLGSPHEWTEQPKLARRLASLDREIAERHLSGLARQLGRDPVRLRTEIVEEADATRALQRIVEDRACSLVVLSAHGGLPETSRPYGPIPRSLVEQCDCPVLVFQDTRTATREPQLLETWEERTPVGT